MNKHLRTEGYKAVGQAAKRMKDAKHMQRYGITPETRCQFLADVNPNLQCCNRRVPHHQLCSKHLRLQAERNTGRKPPSAVKVAAYSALQLQRREELYVPLEG
jgi:hypothetical protein